MEISVSHEQARVPVTVFHVDGNLTGNTYQQFEDTVQQEIKGGAPYVLIDLTNVGYISSAGLRSLHYLLSLVPRPPAPPPQTEHKAGAERLIQKSPYLKLLNPSQRALQPLQLVGFDKFFEIYDDYRQALASY
jgi:anti-anti-sigma regulatory factor